ncbi:MAG: response regulator transcription factor [Cellvibrionaceae bacterium]|nr:response regulator transcription factor [Cellvibrionaceae bacterium]MCV6625005.1 response regulator transcription factor [Cellvibrionaceae bacterium]
MRVLIIDDHHLFRSGLRFLLTGLKQSIQYLEASSCEEATLLFDSNDVDVVLLDYYLPGVAGVDALERIKNHFQTNVVVISSADSPEIIHKVINRGAVGFIPKSSSPEVLVAALKLVLAKGVYLPPNVLDQYSSSLSPDCEKRREELLGSLSARQLAVLMKAIQGLPNKAIAHELDIAEGTVKSHLFACYRALEVDNRTDAVYVTASLGLIPNNKQ